MIPDGKVHGANMGPICGRKDQGGHHVGLMNFAVWDTMYYELWRNVIAVTDIRF